MKSVSLLVLIILFICAALAPYLYNHLKPYYSLEGFDNHKSLENISVENIGVNNSYPLTQNNPLLEGTYQISGKNGVTRDQGSKIWWHYPIFKVGSFKQLTNNLRHYKNPDTGNCMAAEFCGTLYKNKKVESNIIRQLPPVEPSYGARVNYYNTELNMFPFRSDTSNILY